MDIIIRDKDYTMDDYFRMYTLTKKINEALFEYILTSKLTDISLVNRRGYGYSYTEITLRIKYAAKFWDENYLKICDAIEGICHIEPAWMDTAYNYIFTGEGKRVAIIIK